MNAPTELTSLRIVILDDNPANLAVAEQMFTSAGYSDVSVSSDPAGVIASCEHACPDLLILDLHMPGIDGFEVLARLQALITGPEALPVLVATADTVPETRARALTLGARDFVTKPLDMSEVLLRARNHLQTRALQLALQRRNGTLAEEVRERTAELEQSRLETLERLALIAECRDHGTWEHSERIGRMAELLARRLEIHPADADLIRLAAPLHDIGKIAIPDEILLKPTSLTDAEWATMKSHTTLGAAMLSGGSFPVLRAAAEIALSHHERFDGRGYPQGLAGEDIPLMARIVAVADVFDALTHERPYKQAYAAGEAVQMIAEDAGHFDPRIVGALISAYESGLAPLQGAER
jgi:putative two-component system response regulator